MQQKNLEEKISFLDKVKDTTKKYAGIYATAATLALGAAALGGCGESYCCEQLDCGNGTYCEDDQHGGGGSYCIIGDDGEKLEYLGEFYHKGKKSSILSCEKRVDENLYENVWRINLDSIYNIYNFCFQEDILVVEVPQGDIFKTHMDELTKEKVENILLTYLPDNKYCWPIIRKEDCW